MAARVTRGEPELWRLIRSAAWPDVIERLSTNPEEAAGYRKRTKSSSRNSLHLAVDSEEEPPLHVVRALMEADPAAVSEDSSALARACERDRSDSLLKLILQSNPHAVKSIQRRHIICLNDLGFNASLDTGFVHYALQDIVGKPQTRTIPECIQQTETNWSGIPMGKVWDKVCMMVRAHYCGSMDESIQFSLLHAFVSCTRFMDNLHFVRLAIKLNPEQLALPDSNGNLPLHLAAMVEPCKKHGIAERTRSTNAIRMLLAANPSAASIKNRHGKLPIQLAIESENKTWDDGIEDLWMAFPMPALACLIRRLLVPAKLKLAESGKSMDPLVNYQYRLCFSCTEVKKLVPHFCISQSTHCVECARVLGIASRDCDCCCRNHIRIATVDTLCHITSFLDLENAFAFRSTCRQVRRNIRSPFRHCAFHMKPSSSYGPLRDVYTYNRQLDILKKVYSHDSGVVQAVIENPTVDGNILKDLLLFAIDNQDMANISALLNKDVCQVDGVLAYAILNNKEDAKSALLENDRVKASITICSYCSDGIGAIKCRNWDGDDNYTRACERETCYDDLFCLDCAADQYCSVCKKYECRECGDFTDANLVGPDETGLQFYLEVYYMLQTVLLALGWSK